MLDPRVKPRYIIEIEGEKKKCKGVTTITEETVAKGWLADWKIRLAKEKIKEVLSRGFFKKKIKELFDRGNDLDDVAELLEVDVSKIVDLNINEGSKQSREAKDNGSMVHDLISDYFSNKSISKKLSASNNEVQNAFKAFMEWKEKNVDQFICGERVIFKPVNKLSSWQTAENDHEWAVAGRFDAIIKLKNGKNVIVDFKACKKQEDGYYQSFREQLGGYYYILKFMQKNLLGQHFVVSMKKSAEHGRIPTVNIDGGLILRLDKDTGMPDPIELQRKELVGHGSVFESAAVLFFKRLLNKHRHTLRKKKEKINEKKAVELFKRQQKKRELQMKRNELKDFFDVEKEDILEGSSGRKDANRKGT